MCVLHKGWVEEAKSDKKDLIYLRYIWSLIGAYVEEGLAQRRAHEVTSKTNSTRFFLTL